MFSTQLSDLFPMETYSVQLKLDLKWFWTIFPWRTKFLQVTYCVETELYHV